MRYTNQYIRIGGEPVKQVNRIKAAKLFNGGKVIYLHPCNMMLNNMWQHPMPISKNILENPHYNTAKFESIANEFEMYNCCNERGNYANFFVVL